MDIRFVARNNVVIPSELKSYMEQKLSRMDKFFSRILDMQLVVKSSKNQFIVEVTADANGVILRGEQGDHDLRKAFDLALKNLERRIRRHKDYLTDKAQLRSGDISFELGMSGTAVAEEPLAGIVREKVIELHPMTTKEAIQQMDLLGHSFFLFDDVDSGRLGLVYRREAGGYGLLKPRK